jgi:hypothetical protein
MEKYSMVLVDRAMFADLTGDEWDRLCEELQGRVENYLEEIIDDVLADVQSDR